jgi:LPXTG-motif cell wall-anchored protein
MRRAIRLALAATGVAAVMALAPGAAGAQDATTTTATTAATATTATTATPGCGAPGTSTTTAADQPVPTAPEPEGTNDVDCWAPVQVGTIDGLVDPTTTTVDPTTTTVPNPTTVTPTTDQLVAPTTSTEAHPPPTSVQLLSSQPTCDDLRRNNIPSGDPAYRPDLDADHDGIACDAGPGGQGRTAVGGGGSAADPLPNTGRDSYGVIAMAMILVAAGGGALTVAKRRTA